MKSQVVEVSTIKVPITKSPGFAKKGLSSYKLDICGLCGFGCRYCSSNHGNYLRINRSRYADLTERQLGERLMPATNPELMFVWTEIEENLDRQLRSAPADFGAGETLVYSMLTDAFSPLLLKQGLTRRILERVFDETRFRVRVLTKNAIVGTRPWIEFFNQHRDRVVVGLSTGTLDDAWAKRIEVGTSLPTARLKALQRLQDAGIPTFGMLCPIFPDMLQAETLERLVDAVRPDRCEHVWAEPYNDRDNWKTVRDGYPENSVGYDWLTLVYEQRQCSAWSRYATEIYERLRRKAIAEGWLDKLRYLLYEDGIVEEDAPAFRDLKGVWLQSKPAANGQSCNAAIARYQPDN